MKIQFGFGKGSMDVNIPDGNLIRVLTAKERIHALRGTAAIEYALDNPIGKERLTELVRKGMKVVIVASDISRPSPSWEIVPPVVDRLNKAGIPDEDITVVFALGSHRGHTEEEKKHLIGEELYYRIKCEDSQESGFIHLGTTEKGTPVDICGTVAAADFVICTGNIEYHYFAGYSGGAKAIMPGCSTKEAIQKNHTMMLSEGCRAGSLCGNPLRDDIEEAGRMLGIDYIVNVVLDEHKKTVFCVAGDPVLAHREGCSYLDSMYHIDIEERADIVLVSQGGAPKDANLYQTQKALENSKYAVKDGGTIILIGECREGFGSSVFEEWLREAESPESLCERIGKEFRLGGHKAAAIGKVLTKASIYMVSCMDDETVRSIFMEPFSDAQQAFDRAMEKYGEHAKVIAMPYGGATLPVPEN